MNGSEVRAFYKERVDQFTSDANRLDSQIKKSSLLRLTEFLLTAAGVFLLWGKPALLIPTLLIGSAIFIGLVLRHEKLRNQFELSSELLEINKRELGVMSRDFSGLSTGERYQDNNHYYAHDIDLFGKGSFYQYLNRTSTRAGSDLLAMWMKENTVIDILPKQDLLRELGSKVIWRQVYTANANLIKNEENHNIVLNWLGSYASFVPKGMKYVPPIFSLLSIAIILLVVAQVVSFNFLTIWFFFGLGITFFYFKRVNQLYEKAGKTKNTFNQYQNLLALIESESFSSAALVEMKRKIESDNNPASVLFRNFSKVLDALDQRNNMLFGFLSNGLLLWDLHQCGKIELWISKHRDLAAQCFDTISHFDAWNSLGNYVFNHPDQAFPEILIQEEIIRAEGLGHPLIDPKARVDNDIVLESGEFTIITGANMAGKSTFLRTVSLSIVMANMGLPVCSRSYRYSPVKLITSMRTADSLTDDSSYFYAELKRLEFIVQEIKNGNYFIVLDEILKGTNSKDKAEGSKKFLKKLVDSGSSGIIATHDLSLCEIEKENPQVHNMHFDVQIRNDELQFDYLLKQGVCTNMNASFLLRKLKLI